MSHFLAGKKILITGGTGFVGRSLVNRLLESGAQVFVIDKERVRYRNPDYGNQPEVTFWQLDITKYPEVKSVIQKINPNILFHLAALVTADRDVNLIDEMIEVNLRGTTNILKALEGCTGLECMINFGTCEEYGNQERQLDEELREEPASPYAILKLATTRFCNMFSRMFNIPIVTVRPANLYGPGQPRDKFIPYLISSCLQNRTIAMTPGEQQRNFIFIDDFINAVFLIAQRERQLAQIYNIGSDGSVSLRTMVELIKQIIKSETVINFGAINYRENEMMVFDLNTAKIKKLGWIPEYSLRDGLIKTIKFYQPTGDE